jgi:hypothetical protein
MTNSLKSYEKFFEKLEDPNFENETTRSEKEYEWTREVENKEKTIKFNSR